MTDSRNASFGWSVPLVLIAFALVPVAAGLVGDSYLITLFSRIIVFAIAAAGLNLLLGHAGQVSLGHGLYIGVGVYAVGILSFHGIGNGWLHLAAGVISCALLAWVIGTISLKTQGISFLMITLAFAQMGYFFVVSLRTYGGDDGIALSGRSDFGLVDFNDNETGFYFLCLAVLALILLLTLRIVRSPFGLVLSATRQNEKRAAATGFAVSRYKLIAYVVSAVVCALAGILQANLFRYASPASMSWLFSGELIVMIVVGGMRSVIGPVIGAVVLVLVEEAVSSLHLGLPGGLDGILAERWMLLLGLFIVAASFFNSGIMGALDRVRPASDEARKSGGQP